MRHHGGASKPWDDDFRSWIVKAEAEGKDPNDIGDFAWDDDPLKESLERFYYPYIEPTSVVLELGPGSGRATRHIIGRCREMVLVDYSKFVCQFLNGYLAGKGKFQTHHIDRPAMPSVRSNSIDMALANGVFEHIGKDDMLFFLEDFHRVLKLRGILSFNFDTLMSEGGFSWYQKFRGEPGHHCIFRFYHPDVVRRLGEASGFEVREMTTDESRFAHVVLQKRA